MKKLLTITSKELKSFFLSPIAYVFLVVYLIATNFLFFQSFFQRNIADMRNYFELLPWLFLVFIPAITMRTWAEERKNKTLELLLTWPVKDIHVVMGKFLAGVIFLAIALALSVTIPITIMKLGNPDIGIIVASYAGALLMGSAYIAIGMWISSITENQIVAFIGGFVVSLIFVLLGHQLVTASAPTSIIPFLNAIGITPHFESLSRGVIDSRDLIYFSSLIGFFLYLNVLTLDARKWEQ